MVEPLQTIRYDWAMTSSYALLNRLYKTKCMTVIVIVITMTVVQLANRWKFVDRDARIGNQNAWLKMQKDQAQFKAIAYQVERDSEGLYLRGYICFTSPRGSSRLPTGDIEYTMWLYSDIEALADTLKIRPRHCKPVIIGFPDKIIPYHLDAVEAPYSEL